MCGLINDRLISSCKNYWNDPLNQLSPYVTYGNKKL